MRETLIDLMESSGMSEQLKSSVNVYREPSGVIGIKDSGTYFFQYVINRPKAISQTTIEIDPECIILPNQTHIAVVVHGWVDKGSNDWPADVAEAIIQRTDPNVWSCAYFDWKGGAAVMNPVDAASYARDIGGALLAEALIELGSFDHIHLIGHSAGSWAIDKAAEILAEKTSARFHLTFLDAYVPNAWNESELVDIPDTNRIWAEHYYTKDITMKVTHENLTHAHNVDITKVDSFLKDHEFPYRWYYATIAGEYREKDREAGRPVITQYKTYHYGFARSLEAGAANWQKSQTLPIGNKALKMTVPKKPWLDLFEKKDKD